MYSSMWINSAQPDAADIFSRNLRYLLNRVNPRGKPLAFACIGSANVPGDSLGPLMGPSSPDTGFQMFMGQWNGR